MNAARNEHVRISINDEWVKSMSAKVTAVDAKTRAMGDGGQKPTIFKVPDTVRRSNPEAYEPRIISLGPCHHGKGFAMNDLKYRYLNKFLKRLSRNSLDEGLVDCLEEMRKSEDQTRKAYSDEVMKNQMSSHDFVGMMLLDGCFVIETLLSWGRYDGSLEVVQEHSIVSTAWSLREVARDMLLLENQLPFSLLQALFKLIPPQSLANPKDDTLMRLTHRFSRTIIGGNGGEIPAERNEYHHILHFLHSCIAPRANKSASGANDQAQEPDRPPSITWFHDTLGRARRLAYSFSESFTKHSLGIEYYPLQSNHEKKVLPWIPSATQLKEAGIRFRRNKQARSFMDITFKGGEMEIPRLVVDDQTNALLRNLIAFEQCHYKQDANTQVTSYASLMDCIVNTADDIVLLQKDKIVINSSGDNKEVADFFNKLCKDVLHNNDKNLAIIYSEVNKHCGIKSNRWWESLRHLYFKSPWTVIALIAAIFLFALATIQTIYTVLSYIRPNN